MRRARALLSILALAGCVLLGTCTARDVEAQQPGAQQPDAGPDTTSALSRRFAREPSVAEVRRQALRATGYQAGDLDEWSSRARWSHLLPDVQGEVDWLDQRDSEARYREDLDTSDTGQMLRDSARNDFIIDGRLRTIYALEVEWDLSGLIYDKSEASIAREVRRRREARQKLLEEVGEAYYRRRRYLIEWLLTARAKWRERLDLRLEVDRQTARLDAMTGGWFSRALAKGRKERSR